MKQVYKMAFAEIDDILILMPTQLKNKIPIKLQKMISKNKSIDYKPNIKEPFEEQELMEETIIILGLIYRDFLCSPEEKKMLQEKDARELQEVEKALDEEIRRKYNPDNIFKSKNVTNENNDTSENQENVALMKYEEDKWYEKIFSVIKKLFKKN